jgi:hypothetical protein
MELASLTFWFVDSSLCSIAALRFVKHITEDSPTYNATATVYSSAVFFNTLLFCSNSCSTLCLSLYEHSLDYNKRLQD